MTSPANMETRHEHLSSSTRGCLVAALFPRLARGRWPCRDLFHVPDVLGAAPRSARSGLRGHPCRLLGRRGADAIRHSCRRHRHCRLRFSQHQAVDLESRPVGRVQEDGSLYQAREFQRGDPTSGHAPRLGDDGECRVYPRSGFRSGPLERGGVPVSDGNGRLRADRLSGLPAHW